MITLEPVTNYERFVVYGGSPPYIYVWTDPDNNVLPPAIIGTIPVTPGLWSLTVTDTNGITSMENFNIIFSGTANKFVYTNIAVSNVFNITHGFGTEDVVIQAFDTIIDEAIECDFEIMDSNTVQVTTASSMLVGQLRVIIIK
jgi:hypothetical protein